MEEVQVAKVVGNEESVLIEQAKQIIIEGLREHWGEAFDLNYNADLIDFEKTYLRNPQNSFFVALLKDKQKEEVIGTGALIPEKEGKVSKLREREKTAERKETKFRIVRMSVRKDYRRKGVGKRILVELLREAKEERKGSVVVVETTDTWEVAKSFYIRWGFIPIGVKDGDMHFFKLI